MFRRGKLIFLNTKDDRIKVINERIDLTEKHLIVLCQSFAACARRLAKYRDSYDALSQILLNYAEEEEINNSLIGGLKNSANAVTLLGDYMDLKAQRMDLKIVNELAQFENLCKSTRDNLRAAIMARDKEVLKQKQMLEIKAKFSTNNEAADSELFKAKMEVNRRNKEIDDIINNFEKHKLSDLKTILFDFILITMKYHVKSLEVLTANYHDLNRVDEKDDLRIFRRFLRKKWDNQDIIKKKRGNGNLRSQSLDSLDRDQSLSPFKIYRKKSSSIKNLTDTEQEGDNVDDDDDSNGDGEGDDIDISESEKNDTEENDTEEEDNKESVESEDSDAVKTDDDSHNTHKNKNEAKEGYVKNENLKIKKHPFNALPATNISKHLESKIIKQPQETASARLTRATTVTSAHQSGKTNHNKFSVSKSISKDTNRKDKSRRQVTVVESKRSAENSQQADAVIDCTKALRI